MKRIAPSMLTDTLVSSPARINEAPRASRKGHAVGVGRTTVLGLPAACWSRVSIVESLPRDKVHNAEHNNPHGIYKMPVHGENLDLRRVLVPHVAQRREDHDC